MTPIKTVADSNQQQNNLNFYYEFLRIKGEIIDIDNTGVGADTQFSVAHGLGRVPSQVEVLVKPGQSDAYLSIRPGATAWTAALIYLDCSVANASLRIRVT